MSNLEIDQILLLEDREELSRWLKKLLSKGYPHAKVVNEKTLTAATKAIEERAFNLALVDLGLPDGTGLELIRKLSQRHKDCFIVVVTIFDDSDHLFAALKAGAHGYLLKDESEADMLSALQGVLTNKPPISPRMALKMVEYFRSEQKQVDLLSEREREVLSLISTGHSVKQAAELLGISWHTVGDHVKSLYKKLGINTRAQAAQAAKNMGL